MTHFNKSKLHQLHSLLGLLGPLPLLYSDEKPVFPVPAGPSLPRQVSNLTTWRPSCSSSFATRPKTSAIRCRASRTSIFEVSETGAVEQRRSAGSLSPTFDKEVLRVLQALPPAVAPPRHQGQPVRVAYLVPINLKAK